MPSDTEVITNRIYNDVMQEKIGQYALLTFYASRAGHAMMAGENAKMAVREAANFCPELREEGEL